MATGYQTLIIAVTPLFLQQGEVEEIIITYVSSLSLFNNFRVGMVISLPHNLNFYGILIEFGRSRLEHENKGRLFKGPSGEGIKWTGIDTTRIWCLLIPYFLLPYSRMITCAASTPC